jgi:hypothetical protein
MTPTGSASPDRYGQLAGPQDPTLVFPPRALAEAHVAAAAEILFELLPERRRRRAAPRVVKRKMSNYGVKRAEHRNWPRPAKRPEDAVVVLTP